MLKVHHVPFCPLSRSILLGLREKKWIFDLLPEKPWAPSESLLQKCPQAHLPCLDNQGDFVWIPSVLREYINELDQDTDLMGQMPIQRAEVRRLTHLFDTVFYQDITQPILYEKIFRRRSGQGEPDLLRIQKGRQALKKQLEALEQRMLHRSFLAGLNFSWADAAGSAHLSTLDYLGEVPWEEFPETKAWYTRMKSRLAFRPFLKEMLPEMKPSETYALLDI